MYILPRSFKDIERECFKTGVGCNKRMERLRRTSFPLSSGSDCTPAATAAIPARRPEQRSTDARLQRLVLLSTLKARTLIVEPCKHMLYHTST